MSSDASARRPALLHYGRQPCLGWKRAIAIAVWVAAAAVFAAYVVVEVIPLIRK
jgi:hypothetical protein